MLLTAACGPDLGRQNFPRTTVTASAPAADAPITDNAVSLAAQRTVDPCALLDATTLVDLGTVEPGRLQSSRLGECENTVTDTGGKQIDLDLLLGDIVVNTNQATGTVEGLPLTVDKLDDKSCSVVAVTSRSPGSGMTLRTTYEGGDACGAAQSALEKVVQRLHNKPGQLPQPSGSLIAVDFCAVVDDTTITNTLGRGSEKSPYGLHGCTWSGGTVTGYLDYDVTGAPSADDGETKVDLGGGLTGYQKLETNAGKRCAISWLHRPTQGDHGEVVRFQYDNYHDDAAADDACGKALTVVKALLPNLPRP
jgi:hypothetical protein